jgi:flagellar biogenesis protein FliO
MTAQAVSDEEITAILDYIANWAPPVPTTPTTDAPVEVPVDGGLSTTWMLIVLFILLILVFSLWGVRSSVSKINAAMREAEGLEVEQELSFGQRTKMWIWENKVFVSIAGILVVVYLIVSGYDALMGVGVYQGYTPEQPIAFNHTLHAGENQVACVYCHHSATKSKHAGIPSANICMNCHKGINQGRSDEGTAEIQKIYAAVGWDQENQRYTGEENPIKWVKVHNLPDHAYFNHAQHYVVGQIECQECHGQIQEDYTVAGQYAPLTMGWCIDCHNQTAVSMDGNGYYDEVHARLVDNNKEELKKYLEDGTITARELGGWECAKCHY